LPGWRAFYGGRPGRHTALIATNEGVDPARLNVALMKFVRETFRRIAAGPPKH